MFQVTIHPTTPVTVYTLNVKGRFVDGEAFDENLAQRVVVLLNPWSQSDGVYMEDADKFSIHATFIQNFGKILGSTSKLLG